MTVQVDVIVCADAIEFGRSIPDESVDLFFADPPYNLNYGYDASDDNLPDAEYIDWCKRWLNEAIRMLKPTGSLFVLNIPKHAMLLGAYLSEHIHFQHWITWKAESRKSQKPLMPAHYALLYFTKTNEFTVNEVRRPHKRCRKCGEMAADYGGKKHQAHPFGPQISDVWTDIGRAKNHARGIHPCKLPERLVERIIKLSSNPGDVVVDLFLGTGTTADVARRLNRHYICADISKVYVEMAYQRMTIPFTVPMFQ